MADDVQNEPDYSSPYAPPTQTAGPQLPPRQSRWPTVIGIVAIAFAGLGILGGFCGLVGTVTMFTVMPDDQAAAAGMPSGWALWIVITSLLGLGLTVLLLIFGIGLLQRRPWSAKMCSRWAMVYIIYAVINSFMTYSMQQAQFAAMSQTTQPAPMPAGFEKTVAAFGLVIGLVWACALPVFMLIWFSRAKIKDEVASWGGGDTVDMAMPPTQ